MKRSPTNRPPVRLTVFAAMVLLAYAAPAHAQNDPRLRDAVRLAQEGTSDSARTVVIELLRVTPPTDSLYPQALYTMGLVSRSVEDMRRNYTRVAVEYANSDWADDALYRLALLDYAAGNVTGSVRQLDRLRNDYPGSNLLGSASEWAARALFDQRRPAEACQWITLGLELTGDDVELRNRLDFMKGRCATVGSQPADTAAPRPAVDSAAPAPASRSGFAVQVGAVNTQAAADKLAADLKSAGFTSYVVKEAGLLKVRTGPFPDRDRALAASARIRSRLGGAPFVVKEP